jgi:hypothetical protein
MTASVEAARQYLEAGWAVVPVEPSSKTPNLPDWPMLAAERAFTPEDFVGKNVGVLLGHVSDDLVDIDLDSQAAVALAPYFLPPTLTFGRASKPGSHWLYKSAGVRSAMFFFPVEGGRELVEIRSTNASSDACGHQSVFPGSTHESGEAVRWDDGEHDEPQPVDAGELIWCVARLTVASAILDGWTEGSGRHEKSKGLAGGLLKLGWTADEVRHALQAVREAAGDSELNEQDFSHDVETTIRAFENGAEVTGFGALVKDGFVSEPLAKALERHGTTPENRLRQAKLAMTGAGAGARARMLAEAREVDGIAGAADIVAAFGKGSDGRSKQQAGSTDRHTAGRVGSANAEEPSSDGAATHPFEARGVIADLDVEPAPLTYLWGPFAPGKVSAIASFANGGKSPFAELLALHAVLGRDLFGQRMRQCPAAYLDFEGGRLSLVRLRRLSRGLGLDRPPPGLRFLHMNDAIDEQWIADLDSYVEQHKLGLVVIDTYGAAMAADLDHNSAQFAHWLKQLGRLSHALDVVIVVLLHEKKREQGKRKGSDLEMISGHNAAPGALQGVVSLWRPDEDDKTLISVGCSRAPEDSFETFNIRWEDVAAPEATTPGAKLATGGKKWGLRASVAEKTTAEQKADETHAAIQLRCYEVLTVQAGDGSPMPKAELISALRVNRQAAGAAIDALVATGKLGGNYKPGVSGAFGRKQTVWLPGKKNSPIG